MVQTARVILSTDIGRFWHILAIVADMPERHPSGSGTRSRRLGTPTHVVHSADIIKISWKLEERRLWGRRRRLLTLSLSSRILTSLLGLLESADRLGPEEGSPGDHLCWGMVPGLSTCPHFPQRCSRQTESALQLTCRPRRDLSCRNLIGSGTPQWQRWICSTDEQRRELP